MYQQTCRERDSINGTGIYPQSVNGQTNSGTIDMSLFNRACWYIMQGVGAFQLNATLYQGNNSNGSDGAAISANSFQVSNAANSQFTVEIRGDQMTYRYAKLNLVTAGAVLCSAFGVGTECRYGPANAYDLNSSLVTARFVASPQS
jgi:hypothetical protein